MTTKHNCPHPDRSKSRYKFRLKKRGLSKAPVLTPVESLSKLQERRIAETCTSAVKHRHGVEEPACNGQPYWTGREVSESSSPAGEKLLCDIFAG